MKKATRRWTNQWDHGCVGWERVTRKWFSFFMLKRREMKYKKQAGGLKFEIWNWGGFENFWNWWKNCWKQLANRKVNGRPASTFVDELSYSNDVSTFILHVLFLLAGITRSAWWPYSPGLGKNFPKANK